MTEQLYRSLDDVSSEESVTQHPEFTWIPFYGMIRKVGSISLLEWIFFTLAFILLITWSTLVLPLLASLPEDGAEFVLVLALASSILFVVIYPVNAVFGEMPLDIILFLKLAGTLQAYVIKDFFFSHPVKKGQSARLFICMLVFPMIFVISMLLMKKLQKGYIISWLTRINSELRTPYKSVRLLGTLLKADLQLFITVLLLTLGEGVSGTGVKVGVPLGIILAVLTLVASYVGMFRESIHLIRTVMFANIAKTVFVIWLLFESVQNYIRKIGNQDQSIHIIVHVVGSITLVVHVLLQLNFHRLTGCFGKGLRENVFTCPDTSTNLLEHPVE